MPQRIRTFLFLMVLCMGSLDAAQGQALTDKKVLTLGAAKHIVSAAEATARQREWNVVIAIVDEGGHLLYLQRMDGAQRASVDVAVQKARSAALFRRPTKVFADLLSEGNQAMLVLPKALPIEGGLPLMVDDQVLGSIGVSGVRPEQDGQIAQAGVAALQALLKE